ncbi:MAG: ATP-binding cassette domain-containing protein [bacterium]
MSALLEVDGLRVSFGLLRAVDGVSFHVARGEIVGLVGESGSGKSTMGRAILRLENIESGQVLFDGQDVQSLRGEALRRFRRRAQMIFQDPFSSLNPRIRIGDALEEPLHVHNIVPREARRARAGELLDLVGMEAGHLDRYPHEFSGGQRQRIVIARAMAVQPDLIIADEPVSALDVSVQAQVLALLKELQRRTGCAYLFVAHDLAVVRNLCDRVLVMQQGRIVEAGRIADVYDRPQHPYTRALLAAVPDIEGGLEARRGVATPNVQR